MTPQTRLKLAFFRICYLMKMLHYELAMFVKADIPQPIKAIMRRGVTIFGNVVVDLKLQLKTDEVFEKIMKTEDEKVFAMMEAMEVMMYMDAEGVQDIANQLKAMVENQEA